MKACYVSYMESLEGKEGNYYFEVEGGHIIRQICSFGEDIYWATPTDFADERYDFTDKPEFRAGASGDLQIPCEEFETMWAIALAS